MNSWWLGLTPAETVVRCGAAEHRLQWHTGELTALDHEDPEAERALAALGGERCACVDALDAWDRHSDDVRALVLASRGQSDPLALEADEGGPFGVGQPTAAGAPAIRANPRSRRQRRATRRGGGAGMSFLQVAEGRGYRSQGSGPPGPGGPPVSADPKERSEDELIALLSLGGALPDRLVAGVAATWRERLVRQEPVVAEVHPQLEAALYGRVCLSIRSWLASSSREICLTMVEEDAEPRLAIGDQGVIDVRLPFGWLVDVWGRGLTTIAGRFCVKATSEDGMHLAAVTLTPDLSSSSTIRLELSS